MVAKKTSSKKSTAKKTNTSSKKEEVKKKIDKHNFLDDVEDVIEKKVHKVLDNVNKDKAEHVFHDFVGAFKGAEWQDYLMFVLGAFFLVWSLIELWDFVRGVILLLLALLLLNMFFSRK